MQINKHGSFYIRNGWPTKIIDAVAKDPHVFSPNKELEAVDTIGVGRVMIKSMRYWATSLGITREIKESNGIRHELTTLGEMLRNNDLFCQDAGTLWLLHRNLARGMEETTAWAWAYSEFRKMSFVKTEFVDAFQAFLQTNGENNAKIMVEKEFDCFKNTYVSDKSFDLDRIIEEDTIPFFAPLRLMKYCGSGRFEKVRANVRDIPEDIVLYCIVEDNSERLQTNRQITIDTLLEGTGQIGRYMNLNYSSLLYLLQRIENKGYLSLVNNFGNRYIQLEPIESETILRKHYQEIAR